MTKFQARALLGGLATVVLVFVGRVNYAFWWMAFHDWCLDSLNGEFFVSAFLGAVLWCGVAVFGLIVAVIEVPGFLSKVYTIATGGETGEPKEF